MIQGMRSMSSNVFPDFYLAVAGIIVLINILICSIHNGEYHPNINNGNPPIKVSVNASIFKYALVSQIAIGAFLCLEVIFENFTRLSKVLSTRYPVMIFGAVFTLMVSSLIVLCYVIPYSNFFVLQVLQNTRATVLFCVTCSFARFYECNSWDTSFLRIAILIAAAGVEFKVFYFAFHLQSWMRTLGIICHGVVCLTMFGHFIKWSFEIKVFSIPFSKLSSGQQNCIFQLVLCLIVILVGWMIAAVKNFPTTYDMDTVSVTASEIILLFYCVTQAIHHSHNMRKESNKFREELEFKRMFVSYISHEVRTPLNTAIMGLQVLLEEFRKPSDNNNNNDEGSNSFDSEMIETVHDIRTSCDIAVNVLNELLTFDKLEGGTLMLEKSEVKPLELIEEVVDPFQIQARKSNIALQIVVSPSCLDELSTIVCRFDRNKIAQVLRNLISNGLKFTPAGGSVLVNIDLVETEKGVRTVSRRKGVWGPGWKQRRWSWSNAEAVADAATAVTVKLLRVSVQDTGAGIAPDNQKRLFKEIVQFNPGKLQKGGGSGLGLYISHGITAMHRGRLSVYSKGEGHGTTFTLTLPTQLNSEDSIYKSRYFFNNNNNVISSDSLYIERRDQRPWWRSFPLSFPVPSLFPFRRESMAKVGAVVSDGGSREGGNRDAGEGFVESFLQSTLRNRRSLESANVRSGSNYTNMPTRSNFNNRSSHRNSNHSTNNNNQSLRSNQPSRDSKKHTVHNEEILMNISNSRSLKGRQLLHSPPSDHQVNPLASQFSSSGRFVFDRGDVAIEYSCERLPDGAIGGAIYFRKDTPPMETQDTIDTQCNNRVVGLGRGRGVPPLSASKSITLCQTLDPAMEDMYLERGTVSGNEQDVERARRDCAVHIDSLLSHEMMDDSSPSFYNSDLLANLNQTTILDNLEDTTHDPNRFSDAQSSTTRLKYEMERKYSYSNLRVLVVDDSALSRKMQCRLLKRRCRECVEAENGKVALDMVTQAMSQHADIDAQTSEPVKAIDLVVMDSNMPVMTGLEAAKNMRDVGYSGIIIGVTGNVTAEDIQLFLSHGADAVLPKPINMDAFDTVVRQHLVTAEQNM